MLLKEVDVIVLEFVDVVRLAKVLEVPPLGDVFGEILRKRFPLVFDPLQVVAVPSQQLLKLGGARLRALVAYGFASGRGERVSFPQQRGTT